MLSRDVTAGIAVMHVPDIARDLLLQDHDMAGANSRHAGSRSRAREAAPVGGEIQFGDDPTEFVQRRLASAERVRASRRATADDSFVGLNIAYE